ncbi:DUF6432 family protein [Haladaptatus sp. DYSN1]|uniref:DUF6432 family protein n=1 Tax=unclassified Haladaptatus TaxID=2622732 RepID=UPI0024068531|nr:DUF6432 family protein [Haladaptatus sp. DYSN1]
MRAKREYRNRDATEVAVLDALVDRKGEGMTVFELRAHADISIDELEDALANLKEAGLIEVTDEGARTVILPDDKVVPEPGEAEPKPSLIDRIIEKFSP